MFLLKTEREKLVAALPRDAVGAEIGVALGAFSQVLLAAAAPRQLHLIDPWQHQADPAYAADQNNVAQSDADRRYMSVRELFQGQIAGGQVVLHRAFSADALGALADGSLDWVYIDGAHHFAGCLADLRLCARKIKPDGLILGHDYATNASAKAAGFGVVEAVNQFLRETEFEMLILTYEKFPTYALARSPLPPRVHAFVGAALLEFEVAVEIRCPELKQMHQFDLNFRKGDQPAGSKLVIGFE
jgi:hypothetical protein